MFLGLCAWAGLTSDCITFRGSEGPWEAERVSSRTDFGALASTSVSLADGSFVGSPCRRGRDLLRRQQALTQDQCLKQNPLLNFDFCSVLCILTSPEASAVCPTTSPPRVRPFLCIRSTSLRHTDLLPFQLAPLVMPDTGFNMAISVRPPRFHPQTVASMAFT